MAISQVKGYTHSQGIAATEWVITHNLGHRPSVQVVVSHNGEDQVIMPKYINHVSVSEVRVGFSTARAGTARCL